MRWYRAITYRRVEVGKDATRNPVTELRETDESILVRTPPWSSERDETEGNRFDMVRRTFLTKASAKLLEGVAAIRVRGALYTVDGVNHEAHTTAISVRRCKDGL